MSPGAVVDTFRTTKNFWTAIALKVFGGERTIVFRNGSTARLSWADYRVARGLCARGFSFEADGEIVRCRKGHSVLVGKFPLLRPRTEDLESFYGVDCAGSTVLDIGGCIGETAVMFAARGAKKIIIYEPVADNHVFIKTNCALNGVNAELHTEGVGEDDGLLQVRCDEITPSLSIDSRGANLIHFRIRSLENVIRESGADIAKLDCEGGEAALSRVSMNVLRLVRIYMIEVHSRSIRDSLIRKFTESGFEKSKERLLCSRAHNGLYLSILKFVRLDTGRPGTDRSAS